MADTSPLYNESSYNEAMTVIKEDNSIGSISDIEFNNEMNLVSTQLNSFPIIIVSGLYGNNNLTVQQIIDKFGYFRTDTYFNSINNPNVFVVTNCKRIDNYWIPCFADIIGFFYQKNFHNSIVNSKQMLYNFGQTDLISLTQNLLNPIQKGILCNDTLLNNTHINLCYTLVFNYLEQNINTLFNAYRLQTLKYNELESLKHYLENEIKVYLNNYEVSYLVTGSHVTYTIKLFYTNIIREIVINIEIV